MAKKIWDENLSAQIQQLKAKAVVRAALFLWNDDLSQAHALAQEIESSTGSLIHGIMHRREPDYSNSQYWLRQVGAHPIFLNLMQEFPGWEPLRFIDLCAQATKNNTPQAQHNLEILQSRELELLTHYCLEL